MRGPGLSNSLQVQECGHSWVEGELPMDEKGVQGWRKSARRSSLCPCRNCLRGSHSAGLGQDAQRRPQRRPQAAPALIGHWASRSVRKSLQHPVPGTHSAPLTLCSKSLHCWCLSHLSPVWPQSIFPTVPLAFSVIWSPAIPWNLSLE